MRIIHVAPFSTPVIGGVEKVVRRIAEHTAVRGRKIYVVARRGTRASHNTASAKDAHE